ncbi:DUF551 domain-containing protein [Cronobacter muytjensii]
MSTISNVTRYRAGLDEDGIVCHREKEDGRWVKYEDYEQLEKELLALRKERERAEHIVKAAEKLVRCKGRYHSEQNYRALAELFGVTTPNLPPLETDTTSQQFESLAGKVVDSWIPCSERMPPENTGVLVATEFDGPGDWRMKWGTRVPGHPDAKNGWLIPGAYWAPSHWQPLPEPPCK